MQANISFRASPVLLARLDRLAAARKSSRSAVITRAIVEATVPEHAAVIADEHEVLVLLSEAARGGSVSAMKALLQRGRVRQPEVGRDVLDELDELALRRPPPVRDGAG